MKVALVGSRNDFDKTSGSGGRRYMWELYNSLSKFNIDLNIVELKTSVAGSQIAGGLSFMLNSMLTNFEDYNIIHHLTNKPFLPLNKHKAIHIETLYELYPLMAYTNIDNNLKMDSKLKVANFVRAMFYRTTLTADYLIVISEQTKREAIKLGYPKDRIFVISLGIDERFSKKIPIKKNKKKFVVGYLGSLMPRKNVNFAIRAFQKIPELSIDFKIYGAKTGDYANLFAMAKNDKRIKFMGFAPEDKIVQIYDSFDVAVHPTLYTGFELEIIEEQSRGIPVVVPKSSIIPEEVKKYCFEAEDEAHMAQIIEDIKENGYNEGLRDRAITYARSFTWKKCARKTFDAYKKVN